MNMNLPNQSYYEKFSDKDLVKMILEPPSNEEAAVYLLYDRYSPLLHSVYRVITQNMYWYDDCVNELFLHLKGKGKTWHTLGTFEWRSTFGTWLMGVADNKFKEILPKLIGKGSITVSIDDEESGKRKVQLPDGGEEDFERRQRKAMLLEAIGMLKDDQRFVILKRLKGYNSKEIAIMLQKKWQEQGIIKYNNKKEIVVPDAAYVDVCTQRAKENLKKYLLY